MSDAMTQVGGDPEVGHQIGRAGRERVVPPSGVRRMVGEQRSSVPRSDRTGIALSSAGADRETPLGSRAPELQRMGRCSHHGQPGHPVRAHRQCPGDTAVEAVGRVSGRVETGEIKISRRAALHPRETGRRGQIIRQWRGNGPEHSNRVACAGAAISTPSYAWPLEDASRVLVGAG